MKFFTLKKAFSLIEMMIYISVLMIIVVVVMNVVLKMGTTYNRVRVSADVERSASLLMDRLIHEIRSANSITMAESNLNAHPGKLVLTTGDVSDPVVMEFFVASSTVFLEEDNVNKGPLTTSGGVRVTNLVFRALENDNSTAVRVELTLEGSRGSDVVTEKYYATSILRGSY